MVNKKYLAALIATAALTTACAGSRLKVGKTADAEVIDAEGSCPVVNNDMKGAQNCSLTDAQKQALEKVIGVWISAKTRVEKAVTIEQNILAKTEGYISKYDIIKQGKDGDFFKTKIRAMVLFQKLNQDLKGLSILKAPAIAYPRVAVLVTDKIEGQTENARPGYAGAAIGQELINAGFRVVDTESLMALNAVAMARTAESDPKILNELAQKLDAEIVIVGEAGAAKLDMESLNLGGMKSYRSALSAKALMATTGALLDTLSAQASGLDATDNAAMQKSLENAGKTAGEDLAGRLPQRLLENMSITLTAQQIADLETLSQLQQTLSAVPGIEESYLRSYQEQVAIIELYRAKSAQLTTQELAEHLKRRGFPTLTIANNTLTITHQ